MEKDHDKVRLLDLLDKEVFDPILRAREEDYSDSTRDSLNHPRAPRGGKKNVSTTMKALTWLLTSNATSVQGRPCA